MAKTFSFLDEKPTPLTPESFAAAMRALKTSKSIQPYQYLSPVFSEPGPTPEDFEKRAIAALDKIELPKFSRRLERRLARGRR